MSEFLTSDDDGNTKKAGNPINIKTIPENIIDAETNEVLNLDLQLKKVSSKQYIYAILDSNEKNSLWDKP